RKVTKGETIIKKGDNEQTVFFVVEGSFFVLDEIAGQNIVLGTIKKGELVGMMSLITNSPRTANVVASEDSVISEIPKQVILASLAKQPFWVKTLFRTLCNRIAQTNKRLAEISVAPK